jgi:hypothetical protein
MAKQETPMLSNISPSVLRYSLSEVLLDQCPQNGYIPVGNKWYKNLDICCRGFMKKFYFY